MLKVFVFAAVLVFVSGLSVGFEGGSGTSGDPYKISTCQQLQDMQNDLSANYVLVNDVDCSGFTGFSSVGDVDNRFTGVLDGQGYTVENLEINEGSSKYVGLIGYLGEGGEVRDIGVVNVDISGGDYHTGGLVGYNYDGSVSKSFSTGSVSGDHSTGGLVGSNTGSVSNSYSTGSVSGSGSDVGGLVARNYGSVLNSYSTGSVSGDADVGGLIGYEYQGSVSSSYWDLESSGQSSSAGGTGLTTSEMQGSSAEGNMSGLDFMSTWGTRDGDYPGLYWEDDVFIPDDLQNPDWTFNGHSNSPGGVAVDGDGYVYSASLDNTVRKISPGGDEVWTFDGHSNSVLGVAVDGDGYVYSVSGDDSVKKIGPGGDEVWTFDGHSSSVQSVAVDSDGYVYSASRDNTVRKISPGGDEVWTFDGHSNYVYGVAVDSDGYVYSASDDGTVRKISPGGDEVWTFDGHNDIVRGVAVDGDGYVYSASLDNTVRKISPGGDEVWTFDGHNDFVHEVAVDGDGYVYSVSNDGTVRKISPGGDEFDSFTVDDDLAYSIGVSPVVDGKQYVAAGTGYTNYRVYRWSQELCSGSDDSSDDGSSGISICDSRGPLNECVSSSSHNVSSGSFGISSVFRAEESAVFESLFGMASISVDNSTSLSGLWRGSFNISTPEEEKTTIKPGCEMKPENGRIIVGN